MNARSCLHRALPLLTLSALLLTLSLPASAFLFGGEEETPLLRRCFQSGVSVVATAHAASPDQLFSRPVLGELLRTGCFDGLVLLSSKHPSVPQTILYKKELTR